MVLVQRTGWVHLIGPGAGSARLDVHGCRCRAAMQKISRKECLRAVFGSDRKRTKVPFNLFECFLWLWSNLRHKKGLQSIHSPRYPPCSAISQVQESLPRLPILDPTYHLNGSFLLIMAFVQFWLISVECSQYDLSFFLFIMPVILITSLVHCRDATIV